LGRPILKLKRIYSKFDGLPILLEEPYKSIVDSENDDFSDSSTP
jgi:hypothetical protein